MKKFAFIGGSWVGGNDGNMASISRDSGTSGRSGRDAYLDANSDNQELRGWLDNALQKFDSIYGSERPGFLDGYAALKEAITPWGH